MADHKVEIYKVRKWKVKPGKLGKRDPGGVHVKVGEKITFHAKGTGAILYFPDKLFGGSNKKITVPDGGNSGKLKVQESARGGFFRYAVYCKKDDEWATGGSYPKIIPDP